MFKNNLKMALPLKPRANVASAHDFFRLKFHKRSGSVVDIVGSYNGTAFSYTPTIAGSPAAGTWTTLDGYFQPEGDNYVSLLSLTEVAAICKLGSYPGGGMLMLAAVQEASNPADSTIHTILSIGMESGTNGMLAISMDNFPTAHVRVQTRPVGGTTTVNTIVGATTTGAMIPVSAYFNAATPAASVVGVTGSLSGHTAFDIGAANTLNTIDPAMGVLALAKNATTRTEIMNAASVRWNVHDIWCICFATDAVASGKLAQVIAEFAKHPHEMLHSLAS